MSHQVKVKTEIKDKDALEATLSELGYTFVHNGTLVSYSGENAGKVDLLVEVGRYKNRVGFRYNQEEKVYDIVGDFYNCGITENTFRNNIKKLYVEKKVVALLNNKRYNVVSRTVDKGSVKILARTMVA